MKLAPVVVVLFAVGPSAVRLNAQTAPAAPMVEQYLTSGKLAEGEEALTKHLQENAGDDQARFGLGVLQVVRGVEHLMQNLYTYGMRGAPEAEDLPYLRLPVPANPNPKLLTYDAAGDVVRQWNDDLAKAAKTLEDVKSDDVKLPLHIGLIRLDFDADGKATEDESLWKIYAAANNEEKIPAGVAQAFLINFDAGDVQWLRGYCHLLMALNEVVLAYDEKELFDHTAHLFFKNPQTPFPFLKTGGKVFEMEGVDVADVIAFVHLLHCPVKDPKHMQAALEHLQTTLRCSRESWKHILTETDNDHEWIPNPKQDCVIPDVKVTQEMVDHWMKFLDESDALLSGKKLAPFWRGDGSRGVNLHKVFTEPRSLDLVLWVQGSAAAPYLEQGQITDAKTWEDIWNAFGQDSFFGFAAWFN